ncbi:MAG: YlxR family protein [Oscillospiraceae bacterium]|nr:YlxR family protein [Oscillospiraceae bacterium]
MPKTIPIRQCLGCRIQKPKNELVRVVRSPEGTVSIDGRGKAPGRGAYLCRDSQCLRKAVRSKALERALGVPIPEDVMERLRSEMEAADG